MPAATDNPTPPSDALVGALLEIERGIFGPGGWGCSMTARASRRGLLGASAAMLLLVPAAAGASKAQELDSELLAVCAVFQRAEAAVKAADDDPSRLSDAEWVDLVDVPGRAWQRALEAVRACPPPRTPEGLQAKARAAHTALARLIDVDETHEALLALECLADVAGRAGA